MEEFKHLLIRSLPVIVFWICYLVVLFFFFKRKRRRDFRYDFVTWQKKATQGFQEAKRKHEAIKSETERVNQRADELGQEIQIINSQIDLALQVEARRAKALVDDLNTLEDHPPPGYLGLDFQEPVLAVFFQGDPHGLFKRRNHLEVLVDLERGAISGPLRRWPAETRLAALKLVAQGRLSALVRMIQNSLLKEERK